MFIKYIYIYIFCVKLNEFTSVFLCFMGPNREQIKANKSYYISSEMVCSHKKIFF